MFTFIAVVVVFLIADARCDALEKRIKALEATQHTDGVTQWRINAK